MMTKEEWNKRKEVEHYIKIGLMLLVVLVGLVSVCICLFKIFSNSGKDSTPSKLGGIKVESMLLTPNAYSRSQLPLEKVTGIVIHQGSMAKASAVTLRNSYEELRNSKEGHESVHLIVGLDGEVIQCVPLSEVAYAAKDRNLNTISIEACCYDESGQFSAKTYETLVKITAALCSEYDLKSTDVIRHYDVTGLKCPEYYVDNEASWQKLLSDVQTAMAK